MATNGGAHKFNENDNNWLHKHFEHTNMNRDTHIFWMASGGGAGYWWDEELSVDNRITNGHFKYCMVISQF